MKRFLSMYRVEQKLFLRTPDVILFCLAMPLVVFVVITMITGGKNGDHPKFCVNLRCGVE